MNSNNNMHSSQINNKSSLSSFTEDLETFENAYYVLLDKSKAKLIEFKKEGHNPRYHWDTQKKYLSSEYELAKYLIQIFRYFINVNMMRILFDYPVQTKDAGISQDIDSIFSKKIKEIQLRISEVVKGHLRIKANYNEFADCFMDDSNTIAWFIGHLIKIFTIMNMEKEVTDVIQCLLRFSKGLLPLKDILYELRWRHDIILKVPI